MELYNFQKQVLETLHFPVHVVCTAPTGAGKTLIFEEYTRIHRCKTLVVSPLIALAEQQMVHFRTKGFKIGEDSPPDTEEKGIWILSPEKLSQPAVLAKAMNWKPDLFVVDECHCIWEWGDTFRPAFSELPQILQTLGTPRSLWLSATLPLEAKKYILEQLPPQKTFIGSFDLPEHLYFQILKIPHHLRYNALKIFLYHHPEPGVIFTTTRESARSVGQMMEDLRPNWAVYHGGLTREKRTEIQSKFETGEVEGIVATTAFGLGVHYPKMRWALLWQTPYSILSLAQLAGRIRGPEKGEVCIFWDIEDYYWLSLIEKSPRKDRSIEEVMAYLGGRSCHRERLKHFFERDLPPPPPNCGRCDFCMSGPRLVEPLPLKIHDESTTLM